MLDENVEVFVVHMASLIWKMTIYLAQKAQIVLLLAKEVTVLVEYTHFTNVFSKKSAEMLLEQTSINKYTIKFEEGKQSPYESIHSLELMELQTFKTYIKTNLANGFIQPSKSPFGTLIFFVYRPNNSLCLYINCWSLNNLTIKNWYLLPLISKSLDWLE